MNFDQISENKVLPLYILPPITWWSTLILTPKSLLEKHENFIKGTLRNRFEILGPNGRISIHLPINGGRSKHQKYNETEIILDKSWLSSFKKTIVSSYANSPFFEHYETHFFAIFEKNTNLFQLNSELFQWVNSKIHLELLANFTTEYLGAGIENLVSEQKSYPQVFESKFGFTPNLSILDLIFNCGPRSKNYV